MPTNFSPTPADVERYRRLRAASLDLSTRIFHTVPRRALMEIGQAIGIVRDGTLIFDDEGIVAIHADCCIYDWLENGKNVIERYGETHPAQPGTDEHFLLESYRKAEYRILLPQSAAPGAGIYCRDAWTREELFLMDVNFSRSREIVKMALATRIVPCGDYWISTGAGLPMAAVDDLEARFQRIAQGRSGLPANLADSILIVRACLKSGAADHIAFAEPGAKWEKQGRNISFTVEPTDLCTCRSGLMYKYCCGRAK